ncbi:MAG: hypothetical protein A3K54_02890 [Omnitrophica WOR_2 bacterium RBG_13_44_8]|nr:MAG: hypothetical protein A3K54_02890 [Omnitrophica WOR_2 bacterium RBG_13_44_8]
MSVYLGEFTVELVISEFNGEIRERILDNLNKEYLLTGKFVRDQRSISPKILSSLMLSSGAAGTAVSAMMSSSLFMATANPATLMRLGSGVGSAVMGAHGIVAQAAFIPVASSIAVVAPLMVMQALNSVVLLQQFNAMDKKLDAIKGSIDKILARQEVTKVAELFAAVNIVDEIYLQLGQAGRFSTDMLIRLALAERDALMLSRRYEMLENCEARNSTAYDFANYDTFCTMLASFLNLRVKYLRTSVDIQENPQFVQRSSESFAALLKDDINLWDKMLHKSDEMKSDIEEIAAQLENVKGLQRIAQKSKEKELSRKKDEYANAMEKERVILKDFHTLIDIAKQISETTSTQALPTLVYWHDDVGEHCIATNEQILDAVGSGKIP